LPNLRCRRRGRFSVLEPCLGEYSCDPGGYKGIIVHPCIQIINFSEHQNDKVALFSANVDKTLLDMDHRTEGNFLLVPSSNAWKEQLAFPKPSATAPFAATRLITLRRIFMGAKFISAPGPAKVFSCLTRNVSMPPTVKAGHDAETLWRNVWRRGRFSLLASYTAGLISQRPGDTIIPVGILPARP